MASQLRYKSNQYYCTPLLLSLMKIKNLQKWQVISPFLFGMCTQCTYVHPLTGYTSNVGVVFRSDIPPISQRDVRFSNMKHIYPSCHYKSPQN